MTYLVKPAFWLAGYIPDLPTPFDEDDRLDLTAFAKLCERQIEAGVRAIVVGETTGEASTLTPAEHDSIVRAAVGIARGRVRVIAGAGSNSTSQAIELTRRAEAAGADAVLSVVPYYNKPMQAGIDAHFRAIAGSTALPIILHDIPSRTNRELSDDTLARLIESKQFIGLRDGTGDLARPLRLQPLLIIPVVILSVGLHSVWLLLLHLACFFVIAMVCHGELARSRPNARDLTEFYLWISLGGVLGGLFDALLAPLLFPDIWEYPLMLVAAPPENEKYSQTDLPTISAPASSSRVTTDASNSGT